MPSPINEGLVTRGLASLFALKGRFRLQLDETEVPVILTSQFDRSPFQLTKPCGGGLNRAAVAAERAYVFVSPNAGVILCVDKIILGTLSVVITIQRLTVANIATLGAPLDTNFLRDFNAIEPPQANGPRTSSVIQSNTNANVLGDTVAELRTEASVLQTIDFPDGYFLYGNDPAGIGALAVVADSTNSALRATFFCREFRLPG